MSYGSIEPAATMSPLAPSIARQLNYAGLGVVSVLKFLYFTKSYALTVPSKLADKTAFPFLGTNCNAVILLVCSVKVTKQRQFFVVHNFSFPSSPPVARKVPSGE
jgi:hypothetical protein